MIKKMADPKKKKKIHPNFFPKPFILLWSTKGDIPRNALVFFLLVIIYNGLIWEND